MMRNIKRGITLIMGHVVDIFSREVMDNQYYNETKNVGGPHAIYISDISISFFADPFSVSRKGGGKGYEIQHIGNHPNSTRESIFHCSDHKHDRPGIYAFNRRDKYFGFNRIGQEND